MPDIGATRLPSPGAKRDFSLLSTSNTRILDLTALFL